METLLVKVKSSRKAAALKVFLESIDYVETVADGHVVPGAGTAPATTFVKGDYNTADRPSDLAGTWSPKRKVSGKSLRQRAWERKK